MEYRSFSESASSDRIVSSSANSSSERMCALFCFTVVHISTRIRSWKLVAFSSSGSIANRRFTEVDLNQTLVANDVELGPERAAEPYYQIQHPNHLSEDEDTWVWTFGLIVVADVVSVDKLEMEKRTGLSSHVGFESIQ